MTIWKGKGKYEWYHYHDFSFNYKRISILMHMKYMESKVSK